MALLATTTEADITVPFCRAWGRDREGFADFQGKATWGYKVRYADRWTFIQQVNGVFTVGGTTTYRLPMQNADVPALLVASGSVEPRGAREVPVGQGHQTRPVWAFVDVDFAVPAYDTATQLSVSYDVAGQVVTVPGSKFTVNNIPLDQARGQTVPVQEITVTRHRVGSFDLSTAAPYAGCVNSDAFYGAQPGTVLFEGCQVAEEVSYGGAALFEVSYKFAWRYQPWNMVLTAPNTWAALDQNPNPTAAFQAIFS